MADVQLKHGFTMIANAILENLAKQNFSPNETRVILVVIRQTYGFGKKTDRISLSQFASFTGMWDTNASRAIKSLIARRIVFSLDKKQLQFNKDYDQWVPKLSAPITPTRKQAQPASEVISTDNHIAEEKLSAPITELSAPITALDAEKLSVAPPQKKDTKETIQKKLYGEFLNVKLSDAEHQKLIERFGEAEAKERIENCSAYLASKGDKYKDHYATIQNWARRDGSQAKGGTGGKNRRALKTDGWKDWAKFASPGDAPEYLRQGAGDSEDATSMGSQPPLPLPP